MGGEVAVHWLNADVVDKDVNAAAGGCLAHQRFADCRL